MELLILRSKVPKEKYDELLGFSNEQEFYLDFHNIHNMFWSVCNRLWTAPGLTPEIWRRYELMEVKGLRVQVLLQDELVKLRHAVKKVYKKWQKRKRLELKKLEKSLQD